jgi:hypothetical protein
MRFLYAFLAWFVSAVVGTVLLMVWIDALPP